MSNIFIEAGIIAFIYFVIKFIEMRFVEKESKPLKYLIRDSLLVYFSVICGNFVIEQLKPVIQEAGGEIINTTPSVFTDNPEF